MKMRIIKFLAFGWLLFDSFFAILCGNAQTIDYFTICGLFIFGIYDIIRSFTRRTKQ